MKFDRSLATAFFFCILATPTVSSALNFTDLLPGYPKDTGKWTATRPPGWTPGGSFDEWNEAVSTVNPFWQSEVWECRLTLNYGGRASNAASLDPTPAFELYVDSQGDALDGTTPHLTYEQQVNQTLGGHSLP